MSAAKVRVGVFLLAVALLICCSCSSRSGPRLPESPAGRMAIPAPEGYANRSAAARNEDGMDHLLREHWEKAAADFRRALEADPDFAAAHFNLALALDREGKREEAAEQFKQALRLAPADARIRENEVLKKDLQ
ncbi:MAG TPA: tetratricopeptide repeat protein [Nitrospiria bacterium]|nr:tetratricopeptide repeat protein [Nitrospiria bacterium]